MLLNADGQLYSHLVLSDEPCESPEYSVLKMRHTLALMHKHGISLEAGRTIIAYDMDGTADHHSDDLIGVGPMEYDEDRSRWIVRAQWAHFSELDPRDAEAYQAAKPNGVIERLA